MTRRAQKVSFTVSIGEPGSSCSVEWRWPDINTAVWLMAEKDGCCWLSGGPLTEEGRGAILKRFRLESVADQLPLAVLARRAPKELELVHFSLHGKDLVHFSDRIGDHIEAQLAA